MRTLPRTCFYESDWDLNSVFAQCESEGVPPDKVVRAMRLFARLKIPAKRIGGALAIVFRLGEIKEMPR